MSIFKNAYETSIGTSFQINRVEKAIQAAMVRDGLASTPFTVISSTEFILVTISGFYDSESNIPFFTHPIILENVRDLPLNKKSVIAIDIRQYMRQDRGDINFEYPITMVRATNDFKFLRDWGAMQVAWSTEQIDHLQNGLEFSATLYAAWISGNVAKYASLDPLDQLNLFIVAHLFYQTLFYPQSKFGQDEKSDDYFTESQLQAFALKTAKASKAKAERVFEIIDQLESLASVNDFVKAIKKVLNNIRLQDFDERALITATGRSWYFGTASREILAVALEHPPTWVSVVNSAISDRLHKNDTLNRLAMDYGKGGAIETYQRAFQDILSNILVETPGTLYTAKE